MDKKVIKAKDDIIQDTSAGDLVLDVNAKDPDVRQDGIIEMGLKKFRKDTIVFAMRMEENLLNFLKQKARVMSAEKKTDISYQMLICEAVEEKYHDYKKGTNRGN